MNLVILPLAPSPDSPSWRQALAPDFGGVDVGEWGQASNEVGDGVRAVWTTCAESALSDLLVAVPAARLVHVATQAEAREIARLRVALKSEKIPRDGRKWNVFHEHVDAYRVHVLPAENAHRDAVAKARRDATLRSIAWVVVHLGLAYAASRFGPHAVAAAVTLLHADNFNAADATNLNGRTMSDGLGAWTETVGDGGMTIVGNVAKLAHYPRYLYDSAMSDVDELETKVDFVTSDSGPLTRFIPATSYGYLTYWGGGPNIVLYENGTFTSLGSVGGSLTGGDNYSTYSTGTSHSSLKNGSAIIGPVTDATTATGKSALLNGGGDDSEYDNFANYVAAGATGNPWNYYAQQ